MKKIVIATSLLAFAGAFASEAKRGEHTGDPLPSASAGRIAEIASYLPEKPSSPGAAMTDRKAWGRLAELESAAEIVKEAEAVLRAPVPECPDELFLEYSRNGNRRNYEIPYRARISNAMTLAVAECFENKGRFIGKLCGYLEAICSERSWVAPAHDVGLRTFRGEIFHVDLGASRRARTCAWIVSIMGDSLPADLSRKVKDEIERRVFASYRAAWNKKTGFSPLNWFAGSANWTAVCHCGVVCAALAVIEDRKERAAFVEAAERCLPYFIAGFPPDGYCSEGMGYWVYGWGHYLRLGLAVRQATGGKVDFFADPKTRTIMEFGTGFQMTEGRAPDFADGSGRVADTELLLGHLRWPDLPVNRSTVGRDLLYGGPTVFFYRAFGQLDGFPPPRADRLPIRNAFPFGQVWVFRQDPGSDGEPFSVGLKGGHNDEYHNHNDVGSYAVLSGETVLSGDPGGTQYTALTFSSKRYTIPLISSYGHPVPVLNGCLQEAGRRYAAKILGTEFAGDRDRVVMDIAGAYPEKAGVRSVVRTFDYDRKGKRFSVTDKVTFRTRGAYSVPILTPGSVEPVDGEGLYAIRVATGGKTRECRLTISVNGAGWKLSGGERIDNPHRVSPMRYSVTLDAPVETAEIKITFSAVP